MDQGIKSRPRYGRLRPDPEGKQHLVLSDQRRVPDGVFEALPADAETWVVDPGHGPVPTTEQPFTSASSLLDALRRRVATATAGLRVYAVGTEGFIWDAEALCREAGMGKDEIMLAHAGSLRRRVWCVHCATTIDDVITSIVGCPVCGANLFVRDHFSRRLRAFMGVQADAEMPGEVPPAELLYR